VCGARACSLCLLECLRAQTSSMKTPVLAEFPCRFEMALFLRSTEFIHFCALLEQFFVVLGVVRFHTRAPVLELARGCFDFSSRRLPGPGCRSAATVLALPAASGCNYNRIGSNDSRSGSNDSRSGGKDSSSGGGGSSSGGGGRGRDGSCGSERKRGGSSSMTRFYFWHDATF
jgi:uncharacterized membrane protein YgcG